MPSDLDLTPTAEMAANAKRGLELREQHGKGGTAVGVARARDISNRKNLSPRTVKRMHSFFSRHAGNEKGGEDDAGYIAFLLWGGAEGKAWAARKSEQIDKSESARGAARKATMAKFKVGDRIAYKPFPAETAGEIVGIREPDSVGDIQRRRSGQRLEVEYGVRQEGGAIMWISEGMAVKASRAGAKAAFARDIKVRKGNFTDTVAIVGQNGSDPANWYAGLILRHKDGEEQVLWMKHGYKNEATAQKYALQKFDAHVSRMSRAGAKVKFSVASYEDAEYRIAMAEERIEKIRRALADRESWIRRANRLMDAAGRGDEKARNEVMQIANLIDAASRSLPFARPGAKAAFGGLHKMTNGPYTLHFTASGLYGEPTWRLIDKNGEPTNAVEHDEANAREMLRRANAGEAVYISSRLGAKAAMAKRYDAKIVGNELIRSDGRIYKITDRKPSKPNAREMLGEVEWLFIVGANGAQYGVQRFDDGGYRVFGGNRGMGVQWDGLLRASRPGAKSAFGRAERVLADGSVHLDFAEAKQWLATASEAELNYIRRDARQAADAMPDGKKWNYYHDLAIAASQMLQKRRKSGMARAGEKSAHAVNPFNLPAKPANWDGKRITLNNRQYTVVASAGGFDLYDLGSGKKAKTVTSEQLDKAWRSGKVRDIFASTGAKAAFGTPDEALTVFTTLAEAEKASINGNRAKAKQLLQSIAALIARDRSKLPTGAVAFYEEMKAKVGMSRPGAKSAHAADEAVSKKIATLVREGYKRDQAVAIAYDMKRRGEL